MEHAGHEILKVGYRFLAATLLLFLIMSFWFSAPGENATASSRDVSGQPPDASVEVLPETARPWVQLWADLAGSVHRVRSAWLHLYEKAGAPPLDGTKLSPAQAGKAFRGIGTVTLFFFAAAAGLDWTSRRLRRVSGLQ